MNPLPSTELERLVNALIDGVITAEDHRLLAEALRSCEENRRAYVELIELHSLLELDAEETSVAMPGALIPVEMLIRKQQRQGARLALLTAVAALLIVGLVLHQFLVPEPEPILTYRTSPDSRLHVEHPAEAGAQPGPAALAVGSRLILHEGAVELDFSSGVRCVLQAPADVTLGSEDLLRVGTGQAWFHVPQPAAGFQVETAGILVTDLGTEFGVVSRADGRDEVHVFLGKVAIEARTGKLAHEMLAGGAARVVSDSGCFAAIEPRPGRFLATLPTKLPLHLHWAFDESDAGRQRVASNQAPGRIESECVPLGSDRMSACFSVVPGKFGNALSSLGRDGCVETDWPGIVAGRPFTLAYWIKMPPGQSSVESVVAWGAPGPGAEPPVSPFLSSVLDTGDGCVLQVVLGGQGFQGNTRLDDGQWHHLAMVATGRSDGTGTPDFSCYVDGQPEPMSRQHGAPRHPAPPRDADGRSGTDLPPFFPLTLLNHATSQEVLHQDVNLALVREQGTTTAYLNGVPIGSTGGSPPSLGALTTLTIGANRHTSGRLEGFFTGSVDRVRLSTFRGSLASAGLLGAGNPQLEVLADYTFDDHRTPPGFIEVGDPGYAGGRLVLDGDDAIELVPTPLTATDNFVIEARVRMTGLPENEWKFAFPLSNSNGANEGWGLLYQQTWGGIVMSVCAVGSGSASNGHPVALAIDELHIFEAALTRDQIPNLIRHNAMSPPAR